VVEFFSLEKGLNYLADTLMLCGAVLLLAGEATRVPHTFVIFECVG
jgi:hypothetical protein